MGKFTFLHGKGNHICRSFAAKVLFIQGGDFIIIHDYDGKFRITTVQGA